jgi:hypothetical protein
MPWGSRAQPSKPPGCGTQPSAEPSPRRRTPQTRPGVPELLGVPVTRRGWAGVSPPPRLGRACTVVQLALCAVRVGE